MKIFLYYPPLVLTSAISPYPSIPTLSSYLKDELPQDELICKDINIDLVNKLVDLSLSKGNECDTSLVEKLTFLGQRTVLQEKMRMPLNRLERLVLEGLRIVSEELPVSYNELNNLRSNIDANVSNPLFDYWNVKYKDVKDVIDNKNDSPLLQFLGQDYFKDIPKEGVAIVGISVAFMTQFLQAVALAKVIKKINPGIVVVLGGPVVPLITRNLDKILEIFDFIDCFVNLEGEDVLVELARAVSSGKDWRSINGIIFRNTKDSILKNDIVPFDINKSKTPDYSWIYNHNYLDPETLFLRASVGCYYDKCAFCTQSYNRYQQRSLDNVINDVLVLKKVYKVNKIFFSDNSIHFNRLTQIAERIIDSGIRVNWRALSRFDLKELKEADCAKLRKANCVSLFFGLESGVQRVNNLMNKGVDVERAVAIMKQLKKYGIRSSVGSIIGFPGETEEEIVQNIKFLKDNWLHFNAGLAIFGLEHGSAVFSSPEKYSIQKIEGSDEFLYKLNYSYESKDKVPYENIVSLKKTFVIPTWKIILRELTLIYRRFVTSGI